MHHTEINNIPGLLLFIDFEKAFDTVSWIFIKHILRHYNFGPDKQKWIGLLTICIRLSIKGDTYQIKLIYTVDADKGTL